MEVARRLGVSEDVARKALRSQGASRSMSAAKRAHFAHRVERANGLRPGSLYRHVATLYRRGLSEKEIARRLGTAGRTSALILERAGVRARSVWCRSALFVDGVWQDRAGFARELRALREERGLTQKRLGELAGICQAAVWKLEQGKNGPHWRTARRLAAALGVRPTELGLPDRAPAG